MSKKGFAVGTIALVVFLHVPAVLSDWYFYFWWYDVLMHTLGGVAAGFLGFSVWDFFHGNKRITSKNDLILSFGFVVGFVALIGIGWEWAEGLIDALLLPRIGVSDAQLGLTDTMFDLYFDLAGGAIAWLFLRAYEEHLS